MRDFVRGIEGWYFEPDLCVSEDTTALVGAPLPADLSVIQEGLLKQERYRALHVRPEQLSQGVLVQLLQMIARATVHQVRVHFVLYAGRPYVCHPLLRFPCAQAPCVVIDPFCGTGSTGIAALATGNYFLGCEVDDDLVVSVHFPCFFMQKHRVSTPQNSIHTLCGQLFFIQIIVFSTQKITIHTLCDSLFFIRKHRVFHSKDH